MSSPARDVKEEANVDVDAGVGVSADATSQETDSKRGPLAVFRASSIVCQALLELLWVKAPLEASPPLLVVPLSGLGAPEGLDRAPVPKMSPDV